MAKPALNRQTASLAADFKAQGINVALIAVHPGRVPTRMSGGNGSVDLGESAKGMVKIVEELNLENSGRFLCYTETSG
jgi:NAD(P)-dependent dehydrogenase (short-subunit alcohol dehydrogenase family)